MIAMHLRRLGPALVFMGLLLFVPLRAQAAGVHAGLTPPITAVLENEEFTLYLQVLESGAAFNGYDAVVVYDPAALTFLPASPITLQEGSLMTGVCGTTFHLFSSAGDSLVIAHVLLCSGQSLTGPGALYQLRFRAGAVPVETYVRLRPGRTKFYNEGLFVNPVTTEDAVVRIGALTGVTPGVAQGISLGAQPNPARDSTTLLLASDVAGRQRLSIVDAHGRVVRRFDSADGKAGSRSVTWDRRDKNGRRVPAGVYRAVFEAGGRKATRALTLID
jgi:hypothetical protein